MWYEGENYHLFALRGQLVAMGWARQAGVDLLEDERLAARLAAALRAPALTALPDHTFPARKDSRFGVSLAQPMYLELWEVGLARLGDERSDLWSWLRELYAAPAPKAETVRFLPARGRRARTAGPRTRADLSWWALLEMAPARCRTAAAVDAGAACCSSARGSRSCATATATPASSAAGSAAGTAIPTDCISPSTPTAVHWLADPGTGSYVTPRSLLVSLDARARRAPARRRARRPRAMRRCEAFDVREGWSWARGRFGELSRTLVAGTYLLDVVELDARGGSHLELPWHLAAASRW